MTVGTPTVIKYDRWSSNGHIHYGSIYKLWTRYLQIDKLWVFDNLTPTLKLGIDVYHSQLGHQVLKLRAWTALTENVCNLLQRGNILGSDKPLIKVLQECHSLSNREFDSG